MKWLTEIPDTINKSIRIKKEAYKIFMQKKRVLLKSKLGQMEIAYNSNKTKKILSRTEWYKKDWNHEH